MSGRKNIMILLCIVSLIVMPLGASALASSVKPAHQISAASMFADFVAVRPLQFASFILGTATFVVSLPFSALGDNVNQSYKLLMEDAANQTFHRPLGQF
jgi:hypothetical protein